MEDERGRNGKCLELRLVNPSEAIRGCGVNLGFRGTAAFPPDREITVRVWAHCTPPEGTEHTDIALGWHPGNWEGITVGGFQDYLKFSQRMNESGGRFRL